MGPVTRRQFLTTTGAGLAGILATRVPPARGQQREISYLCWNNFAPASDKKLAEIGQRFTKDTGIKLRIDHIAAPQQAAKYASEVQSQAGHDLVEMRMHFPWLYEPQLVDVSDMVAELAKKCGQPLASAEETAKVKGVWRAVPQYHTFFVGCYREDLFKKASLKVPDTWEDLYTVGKELKKMGNPVGIPVSQDYVSSSTASPILWSLGGMEVDKDGKTVRINAPATEQMIEWYRKMYRDCMEPEVLSWTDASNNTTLNAGKSGWIHNPISAYRTIEGSNKELADKIFVQLSPKGPAARRSFANCRAYGVTKFSKNADGAKAFLEALVDSYRDGARASTGYNMPFLKNFAKPPFPIISEDPKLKPLEQDAEYHFTTGYPGPLTPAADEVYQQFVMVDALAQFATDKMDLEQTVKWAEDKIKAIYAKF